MFFYGGFEWWWCVLLGSFVDVKVWCWEWDIFVYGDDEGDLINIMWVLVVCWDGEGIGNGYVWCREGVWKGFFVWFGCVEVEEVSLYCVVCGFFFICNYVVLFVLY